MSKETEYLKEVVAGAVTQNRKRLMGFGILSLILGIIGTFMSVAVTMASMMIFGILFIVAGVVFLIDSFSAPEWKGRLWGLLISLLYVAGGIVMVMYPAGSATWFTLFIAAFLIMIGVTRIFMGFRVKDLISSWGWMVFSGILSIILGMMIYAEWPVSGLWVIGLFISVELIMQGINAIMLSRVIKTAQKDIRTELNTDVE